MNQGKGYKIMLNAYYYILCVHNVCIIIITFNDMYLLLAEVHHWRLLIEWRESCSFLKKNF